MELRHLRYFVATAEELHFGRAARRLSISQPPLSTTIRQLEDELGVRLLERDSKRVVLTSAGEAFLAETRFLLGEMENAKTLARNVAEGKRGRLHIGFVGSMLYRGLPELVDAFQAGASDVVLSLAELNSAEQAQAVARGRLDVGFVDAVDLPPGLRSAQIAAEHFVACLPERHPRAGARSIRLPALAGESFVLFGREASPVYYDAVIALCKAAGFTPRVDYQARHWLTVVAMVARRMGVALVPETLSRCGIHGAAFVPLTANPVLSTAWMIWHPARVSPVRDAFMNLAFGRFQSAESDR